MDDFQIDIVGIDDKAFAPEVRHTGGLTYAIHRFKLDPIISEIKLLFYHLPSQLSAYAWPSHHESSQAAIRRKLEEWRADLIAIAPSLHFDFEEQQQDYRIYEMKLMSQYFAAMIILHQPSQAIPQPSEQSLLICYQCAASRLNTYNDLYNADGYYQSWRSVQGVFSSGATMIYCLWTSNLVRSTIPMLNVMRDLRTCTNLLSVGGECWPSVKKGKESFGRAMDALLRSIDAARQENQVSQHESLEGGRTKRRFVPSECTPEDLALPQTTPGEDYVTQLPGAHTNNVPNSTGLAQTPANYEPLDWTVLGNDILPQGTQPFLELASHISQDAPDATVETFISEYLSGDAAWNPF